MTRKSLKKINAINHIDASSSKKSNKRKIFSSSSIDNKKRQVSSTFTNDNISNHTADIGMVTLSLLDKAVQLGLSSDRLECMGCVGGYRTVRATHGVLTGSYYFEVLVLPNLDSGSKLSRESHVRVGWSTRHGDLQAPVGFDKNSYGYRDISGSKIHNSERYDNYGESYGVYDIIGCFIYLDEIDSKRNFIKFFKNGIDQGVAYGGEVEIPKAVYFPAISLYMQAHVAVNFGPSFLISPNIGIQSLNPISELQPMSPDEKKMHELRINTFKINRLNYLEGI